MWLRIKKILSNKQVMLRIAFTLLILLILRICSYIPVPLVNTNAVTSLFSSGVGFFTIINSFGGESLQRFSIMSMGISPYITASIATQLLPFVSPKFKEWQEEGEAGRYRFNKINRILAMVIAFVQGLALIISLSSGSNNLFHHKYSGSDFFPMVLIGVVICAGTALAIWFSDLITAKGVGNGSSIIIAAGIVISIPTMFSVLINKYITNNTGAQDYIYFILIALIQIAIVLFVVFMETSQRKVPIQYANRQGKSDSNLPIKVNSASVMPVIFASTLLGIPQTIMGFITQNMSSGAGFWVNEVFNFQRPIGFILYVLLIVIFSFFYTFLTVDPNKMAENLSKSNAYIPGVRPGDDTKNYLSKLIFKTTVIGTVYLVFLATLPIITSLIFGFQGREASAITIGGTSILIVVGVAIETTKQIETDASQEQYRGLFG